MAAVPSGAHLPCEEKKKKQDWSQLAPSLLSGSQPTPGATSPPNSTIINTNQAFNPGIKVETQINWVSKLRKSNQDEQLHAAPGAQAVPPGHDVPGGSVPPEVSHPPCLAAGSFIYFSLPGAPPGPCSPARGGPVAGLGREAAPRGAPGGAALTPSRCAAAAGPVSVCVCLSVGLCAGPGPSPWPRRSRWRRGSGGPRGTSRQRGPSGPAAAGGSWRPACAASSSPATWTSASAWGRPTACSASTGTCSTAPSRCVRAAPAVTGFPLGLVVVRACLGGQRCSLSVPNSTPQCPPGVLASTGEALCSPLEMRPLADFKFLALLACTYWSRDVLCVNSFQILRSGSLEVRRKRMRMTLRLPWRRRLTRSAPRQSRSCGGSSRWKVVPIMWSSSGPGA